MLQWLGFQAEGSQTVCILQSIDFILNGHVFLQLSFEILKTRIRLHESLISLLQILFPEKRVLVKSGNVLKRFLLDRLDTT